MEVNLHIKEFKKTLSKKLSETGKMSQYAPPISSEHIIEHGEKFLTSKFVHVRDIMIHTFLLTAMNCGMRYDELAKIRIDHLKCTKYGIAFEIKERCKNSVSFRKYVLRRWPSDCFSHCILINPLFSMSSWMLKLGYFEGYVFCNISGSKNHRLGYREPWSKNRLSSLCRIYFNK